MVRVIARHSAAILSAHIRENLRGPRSGGDYVEFNMQDSVWKRLNDKKGSNDKRDDTKIYSSIRQKTDKMRTVF